MSLNTKAQLKTKSNTYFTNKDVQKMFRLWANIKTFFVKRFRLTERIAPSIELSSFR